MGVLLYAKKGLSSSRGVHQKGIKGDPQPYPFDVTGDRSFIRKHCISFYDQRTDNCDIHVSMN